MDWGSILKAGGSLASLIPGVGTAIGAGLNAAGSIAGSPAPAPAPAPVAPQAQPTQAPQITEAQKQQIIQEYLAKQQAGSVTPVKNQAGG